MPPSDCTQTFPELPSGRRTLPSWKIWLGMGAAKLAHDALTLMQALAELGERRRQRRALLSLDDRILKDIGLTRADVWLEARKPPWRR